ncbi:Peptidase family S41 [Chitinophaga sp. YR573]|uniref:S41 family peptidase n=1 Tax=Chitinophaga sp. YR573 TaxID=1881040 RepID=UPI0008C074BE|nr:S41 family peptidase [Chitinophaga sp. YR573]SEW01169.1 Peptidase family S41 [Chitinophaga sp. YR573]
MRTIFYLLAAIIVVGCHQPAETTLSVKSMQEDLSILWKSIKEMHPAYGMYTPVDSLQKVYEETARSINKPMSETDFISHVYPLLSHLRCGHTQFRHSAGYKNTKEPHLPFEVLVRDHHAWVTTHQTKELNTGDEIVSMNNTPVAEIINHGYDLYAGDGYNETFKELFLSEYDGFEDVCNKYYHWAPPYHISIRTKDGSLKNIQIDSSDNSTSSVTQADNDTSWIEAADLPLRFLKNSSTAWIEVKSYQYNDTIVFKDVFKQIHTKGIKTLIVDLRHNTGGDIRIAAKLLSYLADSAFHIISDIKSRIPNPAINHFEKYFDTSRTASFNEGFSPGDKEGNYYHINFKPILGDLLNIIAIDSIDHFNGKLFVLIDGATFSAGAHSATAIKAQCKSATFIGRETAGGEDGCSGGTIQHLTLPNTGVVVEFPWMRFVSVAKHPVFGHGVMPDYTVVYSAADIVNKTDLDIKKVLSLIH